MKTMDSMDLLKSIRTMKAAVLHKLGEPLVIEDVPVPIVERGEALIQIKASGICGSDLHRMDGSSPCELPMILGHECAGYVAELGEGVSGFAIGDRVSVNCIISCGQCRNCREGRSTVCEWKQLIGYHLPGAFAEYVKIPARNLIPLPESVPFEQGAIITDAVATPFHAITARANIRTGESVAVFGIGGLGYHAVQLAFLAGASRVYAIDMDEGSLRRVASFGAIAISAVAADPVASLRKLEPEGVDVSLEFVGISATIEQAQSVLRSGGRSVICGLSEQSVPLANVGSFVRNEHSLIGSYGFNNVEIRQLIELTVQHRLHLSDSVTETIKLEEINEAVERIRKKIGNPVRIVITF